MILGLSTLTGISHAEDQIVGPWNLTALKERVPEMTWIKRDTAIHSLTYVGEQFQGRPTRVFAFYASPSTLGTAGDSKKFPGVVLIHGGGGTAFADWCYLWAKRGYAAIAMDLAGSRPPEPTFDATTGAPVGHQSDSKLRTRLSDGGPGQGGESKFDSITGDVSDQWPFHAAACVIRAHSLLRSFSEVDADRTAVTGISWGGYTTCLVASLDDRFQAAVPVYGCGFLYEGESVQKPSIDKLGNHRDQWIRTYDPSAWLGRCNVPMLFVNGTNDVHYPLDSYQKSIDKVPGFKQVRIEVQMRHGHPPGWAPAEIGLFIDSYCRAGTPLPKLSRPTIEDDVVRVTCNHSAPLKSAALHFTTDGGLRSDRMWKSTPAMISGNTIIAPKPPADANTWFIAVTDNRNAMVTTEIVFSP